MSTSQEALAFVHKNKKKLVQQICDAERFAASARPYTVFMAGSPGSGKTEFSKAMIKILKEENPQLSIVRLDTDELREMIPQYKKTNSDEVQEAATILFDASYDVVQKKSLNVLVDTTFASPKSIDNVKRALGRGRRVAIFYLYQNPLIAWDYTKKREKLEGRFVPKKVFIDAYFSARKNVEKIKKIYGNEIELYLFLKDKNNNYTSKAKFNISNIDSYINENYTEQDLYDLLPDMV